MKPNPKSDSMDTEQPSELLPCPFCGATDDVDYRVEPDSENGELIGCNRCGASTATIYSIKEDARPLVAEKWNTRTPALELTGGPTVIAGMPAKECRGDCSLGNESGCNCLDAEEWPAGGPTGEEESTCGTCEDFGFHGDGSGMTCAHVMCTRPSPEVPADDESHARIHALVQGAADVGVEWGKQCLGPDKVVVSRAKLQAVMELLAKWQPSNGLMSRAHADAKWDIKQLLKGA